MNADDKLRIATASSDGTAHLVPFSFVWDGQRVTMVTRHDNPAARNAARTGTPRLALGDDGDVVLVDGAVSVVQPDQVDSSVADRLARASAIDGRRARARVRVRCPDCGQVLESQGKQDRAILTHGGREVHLERDYARCSACGSGLFPPG